MFILHGAHVAPDMPFRNSSLTHTKFSRLILSLLNIILACTTQNQSALVFGSIKLLVLPLGQHYWQISSVYTCCWH